MDTISRKLSWDNSSRGGDGKAMKNAMAHMMRSAPASSTGSRYIDVDKVQSWSDDLSGLRPGRNIEDVERDAIDHLFRSTSNASYEYDLWKSPLRNIQNYLNGTHAPQDVSPEEVVAATTNPGETAPQSASRKSPAKASHRRQRNSHKSPGHSSVALNAARDESAADSSSSSSFTPKYEDVDNFTQPSAVTIPHDRSSDAATTSYGAVRWNEPDGLPDQTPEEQSKHYPDLDKYKPVTWNEPNGLPELTPEEASKRYDDLEKYEAVRWNEPDGLPPQTAEELSKSYKDLHKYEAVNWNEPEGLPEKTPEELSKQYTDLEKYKPVEWNEPDGRRPLTPEELSKQYDDLDTYQVGFTASDKAIHDHAASQMNATQKAEPLAAKPDVVQELPQYEDLHKYGPVMWNEPDGLRKLTPEEESKKYTDLHLYGAVRWNEPDGLPKPTPEELSKRYDDLHKYEADFSSESEISMSRIHPEEASKVYTDLDAYASFDNADPPTKRVHPEELSKNYEDLDAYRPSQFDAYDAKYPVHPEEASKNYEDISSYRASRHSASRHSASHPGNSSKDGLEEYDDKVAMRRENTDRWTAHRGSVSDLSPQEAECLGSLSADAIRARVLRHAAEKSRDPSSTASASSGNVHGDQTQGSKTLTGNYVRDFPEEFSKTWSTSHSSSSALLPKDEAVSATYTGQGSTVRDDDGVSSMDESFPAIEEKLQPAMDRAGVRRTSAQSASPEDVADPYSKAPQGLQTSYQEEVAGQTTWPTMVHHYGSLNTSLETDASIKTAASTATEETSSYKVLAYDHATKAVSVADMTSIIPDETSPKSAAEVMLRMSNPARFLPHFAQLQSQGYEVASGSGDVLIFRKVRDASPDACPEPPSATLASHYKKPVNPIDLMGRPVMGNFASPTGFVNYEALAEDGSAALAKPEPPFRSGIDVKKEEPVFSGRSHRIDADQTTGKPRRKAGLGKKIVVGGVTAVGVAYSVGVMGEYFSTGGLDGLGPRGL